MAAGGSAFDGQDLAILSWSFGKLGHPLAPAAAHQLWALLRAALPGMSGRSLATLAAGLAALHEQHEWRVQQQQQQQEEEAAESSQPEAAAAPATGPSSMGSPLLPPQLVAAVAERSGTVLPRLKPFELAQLVLSLSVLGSEGAATQLLRRPSAHTAVQLLAAAEQAPLPDAVGLLWSMARWACYPPEPFAALCLRLRQTSRHYRLPQPALVRLGQALQMMGQRQREALGLRRGLEFAALVAAQQVAKRGPPGGPAGPGSGADASASSSSTPDAAQQMDRRPRVGTARSSSSGGSSGGARSGNPSPAAPQPSFDNENEEDPSWLEMTYEDLARMAS